MGDVYCTADGVSRVLCHGVGCVDQEEGGCGCFVGVGVFRKLTRMEM